jgi:hypothetical protein
MHAPTNSRIGWFLRLQRILAFPKHFLAPQVAKYRSPKLAGDEATPVPFRAFGPVTDPAAAASPVRRVAQGHPVLRPPNRPMTSSSSSVARAITAASAGSATKRPIFQNVYLTAQGGRSGVAVNLAHTSVAAGLKRDHLHNMWRPTPDHVGSSIQTAIQRHISFADTLPISRSNRSHQPQQSAAGRTFISSRPETTLRAPPPPPTGEARPEQTSALGPEPFSGDLRPDSGWNRQRQNIRGASTVHLDGATLGQWTIQHLERALAKPTSGMTGVDPRASLPRGRVSPF